VREARRSRWPELSEVDSHSSTFPNEPRLLHLQSQLPCSNPVLLCLSLRQPEPQKPVRLDGQLRLPRLEHFAVGTVAGESTRP